MAFQPVRRDAKWTDGISRRSFGIEDILTIAGHAKVRRIYNLISGGTRQYSLGMDACFVRKGAEAGDIIIEGDINLHSRCDQVFDNLELGKIVFASDVISISDQHARNKSS